jgi:hypothetical protein
MRICERIFITALAFSAFAASSFASPPGSYEVSAKLSHAGKTFGAPSATVQADKPADIEVSGADGYKLTLTITDLAPDEIQVTANLDSSHGSMAPTVVVRPGQLASVSIGDLGLDLTVSRNGG